MSFRILINREECEVRVAFLHDQELVELHTEKTDEQTIVNNIYRGRVQDVVPGLQAAFIDVGLERNMFLHFMDIRPESLVLNAKDQHAAIRDASKKTLPGRIELKGRRPRQDPNAPQAEPPVRRGDDIIVQVMKDEIGGKAPRVTANLSLAGRYLVMLPFPSQEGGVSRKIAVGQDRFRLKKLLAGLKTQDHSFIIRTAGMEQEEEAIQNDAETLIESWEQILSTYKRIKGPGLLRNDHSLLPRLVRDAFPAEFDEVICDNQADLEEVRNLISHVMPDKESSIKLYDGIENIFEHYGAEKQIERSLAQKYWLKSGGYLIIDENEALTAIDVNTGRFTGKKDQEKTSLKTNIEACEAIARQIRLRDIGGIIVIDFIDMLSRTHQERVSEELRRQLRHDRAKTAIGRIGDFGLMVLTRKRQRMSLLNQVYDPCPYCTGSGWVLQHDETFRKIKYDILRAIDADKKVNAVVISAHPHLLDTLTSRYRTFFDNLKTDCACEAVYRADPDMHVEDYQITPMKHAEGDAVRMGTRRIPAEERVLKTVIDTRADVAAEYRKMAPPVEEELESAEEAREEAADDRALPGETPEEAANRRKRRRRESSSERRARRRRARTGKESDAHAMDSRLPIDEDEEDAAEERESFDFPEVEEEVGIGELPALPIISESASLSAEPALDEEDEAQDETQAAPQDGDRPRRKTRRGSRGGRGRRKRQDGVPVPQQGQPAAAVAAPQPPPPPKEPLRLPPKPRRPEDDLLDSVLSQLEQAVEGIKTVPPAPAPKVVHKSEPTPAPRREPVVTPDLLDALMSAVEEVRQKDEPAAAKGRKAPAKGKKAPAKPAPKAAPAPPPEKPAKKPAAKPVRGRKPAAAPQPPPAPAKRAEPPPAKDAKRPPRKKKGAVDAAPAETLPIDDDDDSVVVAPPKPRRPRGKVEEEVD